VFFESWKISKRFQKDNYWQNGYQYRDSPFCEQADLVNILFRSPHSISHGYNIITCGWILKSAHSRIFNSKVKLKYDALEMNTHIKALALLFDTSSRIK
jgi:hypothetical protein